MGAVAMLGRLITEWEDNSMVERRMELRRRYHRKAKMRKLKTRLAQAKTDGDRSKFLTKIRMLSPFWTPPDANAAPRLPRRRSRSDPTSRSERRRKLNESSKLNLKAHPSQRVGFGIPMNRSGRGLSL